jgi:predicted nucleic acid-binding protein
VVLDTNVLVRHGLTEIGERGWLSAVVLQEITSGAREGREVRELGVLAQTTQKEGRLLVPTGDDWFYTGKVLNSLLRGVRSARGPRSHAIDKGEQQRLVRDVLIARSAKRVNAAVVTYNAGDFEKIRRFCNVRLMPPEEFL